MNRTREDIIRNYRKLLEIEKSDPERFYDLEFEIYRALGGRVVIFDDGETCIYPSESGIDVGRILR